MMLNFFDFEFQYFQIQKIYICLHGMQYIYTESLINYAYFNISMIHTIKFFYFTPWLNYCKTKTKKKIRKDQ